MLADPLHLSRHQRTPSPPPLSSSCISHRRARLKTSNPCNHCNQQYSIIGLTNAAGTLVERYSYTAYGTLGIYDPSGTIRTTSTYANRYTYTGREYDPDLNLYHFRARWYDPATGGFISRDPLGYVDGMSLYRGYFGVKGIDPDGERLLRSDDEHTPTIERKITIEWGSNVPGAMWDTKIFPWTDRIRVSGVEKIKQARGGLERCTGGRRCIKELWIFGHGCPGATLTTAPGPAIFTKDIDALFQGLTFCKPCEIRLHSCHSGVRPTLEKQVDYEIGPFSLAEKVAQVTGCNTYGTKGFVEGWGKTMKIKSTYDVNSETLFIGDDCWERFERDLRCLKPEVISVDVPEE